MPDQQQGSEADETVVTVNEFNEIQGPCERKEARRKNFWQRGSYVFVVNPKTNQICIHLRSHLKAYCPNVWSLTAGGVVSWGETDGENAERELEEEYGIKPTDAKINFISVHRHDAPDCRVWGSLFWVQWQGDIRPQPSEVQRCEWLTAEEIEQRISDGSLETTSDSLKMFRYVAKYYKKAFSHST